MLPSDAGTTSPRSAARAHAGLRTFRRKYLRADLRADDVLLEPAGTRLGASKPSEFLRAGTAGRWAELIWRLLILLVSIATATVVILGFATGLIAGAGLVPAIFMIGLLVFTGAVVLASQAYLRWMVRNWNTPRQRESNGAAAWSHPSQ